MFCVLSCCLCTAFFGFKAAVFADPMAAQVEHAHYSCLGFWKHQALAFWWNAAGSSWWLNNNYVVCISKGKTVSHIGERQISCLGQFPSIFLCVVMHFHMYQTMMLGQFWFDSCSLMLACWLVHRAAVNRIWFGRPSKGITTEHLHLAERLELHRILLSQLCTYHIS